MRNFLNILFEAIFKLLSIFKLPLIIVVASPVLLAVVSCLIVLSPLIFLYQLYSRWLDFRYKKHRLKSPLRSKEKITENTQYDMVFNALKKVP